MLENETETLRLSRQLTPENKVKLLDWVRLAYHAENSVKKSLQREPSGPAAGLNKEGKAAFEARCGF